MGLGSFFKKILKPVKKVASIAAPVLGFMYGGPLGAMAGNMFGGALGGGQQSGIGALVGNVFGDDDGVFDLGMDLWGERSGSGGSDIMLSSILGSVGQTLMEPSAKDKAKEAGMIVGAKADAEFAARRKSIRANYGLPAKPTATGEFKPRDWTKHSNPKKQGRGFGYAG